MAFHIGGANSAADTAYEVANSCRFNDDDSASMTTTGLGTPTSKRAATFSFWIKRGNLGINTAFFGGESDSNDYGQIGFDSSDNIQCYIEINGATELNLVTTAKYRDPSAWYHVALIIDGSQGTAANRAKLYVNGTQVTVFGTAEYMNQNTDLAFLETHLPANAFIGVRKQGGSLSRHFDGYIAEAVYLDGTSAAIGDLGEFDSDSPTIWKPIDVSGLTFGNNGFYLDFEDSGNLGDDESGNTLDFSETNIAATDQCTDTPTNNFATWNSVVYSDIGFSEGNTIAVGTSDWGATAATIALPNAGKWYYEIQVSSTSVYGIMGFMPYEEEMKTGTPDGNGDFIGYQTNDTFYNGGGYEENKFSHSSSANDIYMFAADVTDNTAVDFYIGVNGTWFGSGDPANGSNPAVNNFNCSTKTWAPGVWFYDLNALTNFGNPPFSISSGNADGDGYGNFEYAPPSGFFALNTKNVGEYGG